jgi:hypothetical protein
MIDPLLIPIIGDSKQIARNLNRIADTDDNIRAVRNEFIGKPAVCYQLVTHIIYLRRNIDIEHNTTQFYDLLERYKHVLLRDLDIRWLLSICDTIVDTADVTRSAIAMNIVQCINRCNIDRSILANAIHGDLDLNKLQHEIKVPSWGGMITVDVPNGDMIHNMMTRLDTVVANDPLLNSIWCEIKDRSRGDNAIVLTHICRASNNPQHREFFK